MDPHPPSQDKAEDGLTRRSVRQPGSRRVRPPQAWGRSTTPPIYSQTIDTAGLLPAPTRLFSAVAGVSQSKKPLAPPPACLPTWVRLSCLRSSAASSSLLLLLMAPPPMAVLLHGRAVLLLLRGT